MQRANGTHTTNGVSRREAMASVAMATLGASFGTTTALSATQPWSPEFREWYALAQTRRAVEEADDAWESEHRVLYSIEDRREAGSPWFAWADKLCDLETAIYEHPVHSWVGVAELGMIALFWSEKELRPEDAGDDADVSSFALGRSMDLSELPQGERAPAALIQAVAKLAMGGGHA
jgi:hypothetical protein